jgi:hypothetical protein
LEGLDIYFLLVAGRLCGTRGLIEIITNSAKSVLLILTSSSNFNSEEIPMRLAITMLLILGGVAAVGNISANKQRNLANGGMTVEEFRNLADSLPKLPGTIQSVLLFRASGDKQSISAALATFDDKKGWQLLVFHSLEGRKYQLEWQSSKLDDSFYISNPGALKVFSLGDETAISFEGCARHACPDVFSILLYVPSRRSSFTATYIRGKVTYSPSLTTEEQESYKSVLVQLIGERLSPDAPLHF